MRVGLVCPYNYFRPGGVQHCVRDLANGLEKRGHYVRILAPKPRTKTANSDNRLILLGGSAELNTPFHTKADFGITKDIERIDKLFSEERFDVLHVHEPGIPFLGAQLLARSTAKNIGTMHATLPENMVSKSFEKLMTPIAKFIEPKLDAVTAVSSVAKNIALGYVPQANIQIIPNGIDVDAFRATKLIKTRASRIKTILFIGRLEKRKGLRHLLDAYTKLAEQRNDLRLLIVGDGHLRSRLEARVSKYKIPRVQFLGFVSEKQKIDLLQNADLFCSPALYGESFGIVLLEAMAAGCVTVAGNNPGYKSVMIERGKLSLIDPLNTDEFAERLELLLFDQGVRELWLEWAAKYVRQFDFDRVVGQYEELYKRVNRS